MKPDDLKPTAIAVPRLATCLAQRCETNRIVGAIVGAPGSGKSTLADALAARLNADAAGAAAVVPMDGFHYDDAVLDQLGLRPRKGAPETFDAAGLAHVLERLKRNAEDTLAVPLFDRDLEVGRAGARLVQRDTRCVTVEGNYLLLQHYGLSPPEIAAKLDGNDPLSRRPVMHASNSATYRVRA